MSALKLTNFSVGYAKKDRVVSGISMHLSPGTITAVIGPNGCGKSTLLKGIMGFSNIFSSGDAFFEKELILGLNREDRAKRISYLPQYLPIPVGLTALETVLLGRFPHRKSWSKDSSNDIIVASNELKRVGAANLADKFIDEISGGERRLVNLAAILSQQAQVILLDEPSSSLDYGHSTQLWKILRELASEGKTILLTTHRIGRAFDNVLLLDRGEMVAFGSPEKVFTDDILSRVYKTPMKVWFDSSVNGWVVYS